jgi:hypothetical protein
MLVNTREFTRDAQYFEKHKRYDDGVKNSNQYVSYWKEQKKRSLEGYTVGGMWIPGYYYWYLNFSPIIKTIATKVDDDGKGIGDRIDGFPDFWDVDYMFFMSLDIAKNGISLEDYKKLPLDLNLIETKDNLSGGKHLLWLKPRGVGASYKGGSLPTRNYFLIPRSKSFLFADQKEYLTKDGIVNKFIDYKNFINQYTAFRKRADYKDSNSEMSWRASYDDGSGIEKGYKSEVYGITVGGDEDKGRGKRGLILEFEEGGKFPKLNSIWNIARKSVEQGGIVYGTLVGFGTGGTQGADFESMEEMAYAPEAYNILAYNNIYDEGMAGTSVSMFTPSYYNVSLKDKDGNSYKEKQKELYDREREKAKKSPNPNVLIQLTAESPYSPSEAIMSVGVNMFLVSGLAEWSNLVTNNEKYRELGVPKKLSVNRSGEVEAIADWSLKPLRKYPHDKNGDISGSVVEYSTPYKIDGKIPDDLYFICHDPYASDDAEDVTSLGVAYVILNNNNVIPGNKGGKIVASWVGRPQTTDAYNEILFLLARRWNAKIAYENDRGDVLSYAKRFKLIDWLIPEFELGWDEKIKVKNPSSLKYGMSMGSGPHSPRKLTGNQYIHDWLIESRGQQENGNSYCNYHTILDAGLLDELRKHKPKGNFDRISALRIGMYYMRELAYQNKGTTEKKRNKEDSRTRFFKHKRFL